MAIIDRSGAQVLIPEENSREIFENVPQQSIVMQLMRRLPDMSSKTRSMPVLSSLPMAYWVDGDTGMKQTTQMTWENVKIHAEEIATIVPIPQNVLDDSDYDIWANVKPRLIEAIGATFDKTVLFGVNKPALFPAGIVPAAIAAGNSVARDTSKSLYQQLCGEGGMISLVEADGFVPNGYIGHVSARSMLRGTVDENGMPIFGQAAYQNGIGPRSNYMLDGQAILFPENEVMDATQALLIGGDWKKAVWAVRSDITTTLLTEAVIQDPNTKEIVYNLAQQDMVALRVVFRAGWAMPNPINRMNPNKNTRFPFAVFTPPSAASDVEDAADDQGTEGT